MKNLTKRYLLITMAALWIGAAGPVFAVTTTIQASATIATATITLNSVNDLDFGSITANGLCTILIDASAATANVVSTVDSGTATITSAGTSGQVTVLSPITTTLNVTYSIASNAGTPVADQLEDGSGNTMACTGANIQTYSTASGGTLSVTAATSSELYIGGLLAVGAGQVAGTYTGTITVDVTY